MKRLAVIATALLVVTGCGGPTNTDPRYGRVVIEESNCLFGDCYTIWKACSGPDLVIHNTATEPADKWIENSSECAGEPS